jgi:hypothetical protein
VVAFTEQRIVSAAIYDLNQYAKPCHERGCAHMPWLHNMIMGLMQLQAFDKVKPLSSRCRNRLRCITNWLAAVLIKKIWRTLILDTPTWRDPREKDFRYWWMMP